MTGEAQRIDTLGRQPRDNIHQERVSWPKPNSISPSRPWRLGGGAQPPGQALGLARGVVDDQLDRVDALRGPLGGPAPPARKLSQLRAEFVVDGLAEAHPNDAPLATGQPEPIVKPDRHLHAATDAAAPPDTRALDATGGHPASTLHLQEPAGAGRASVRAQIRFTSNGGHDFISALRLAP